MKKILLSVMALAMGLTASAQLLVKNEAGLIVCKPAAELNNNEFDQNKEDANEEANANSYWYMPAGTVFYEDASIKISAAVQSTICPQSWNSLVTNYGADAYVNLGCGGYFKSGESTMTEDNAKSEIWDPAVLVKGNQGTLLLEAKVSGTYTATVHHSKGNRLIGMYLIYNDAEIEATEKPGKFIATADNVSMGADGATKGDPQDFTCELEAGRKYYLIAGDNNIAVFTQKFEAAFTPIENLLTKNEAGLIVCKPAADLNNNEFDQNKEDANEEANANSYWYMPAGTVFYEDADLKISAAVQSTICPQSWNSLVTNYGADAYVNLGCGGYFKSGESTMTEDNAKSEIWDPAVLVKGNQGTLLLEAKVSGTYTATVHHSKGNRLIGMYLIYNDAEIEATEKPGKFIATADNVSMGADGATKGEPQDFSCALEAGRKYYLIAGDNNIAVFTQKFTAGGVDGIESVVTKSEIKNNNIYSIDGRFVGTEKSSLKSGLYIMNGKKVVVK